MGDMIQKTWTNQSNNLTAERRQTYIVNNKNKISRICKSLSLPNKWSQRVVALVAFILRNTLERNLGCHIKLENILKVGKVVYNTVSMS